MNSSLDTQSRFDQFLNVVVMISISTITTQVEINAENTKYMYGLRSKELSFEFFSSEIHYHSHFLVNPPLLFLPWPPTKKNSFVKHSLFRPELDQITCSTKKCILFFPCIYYSNFSWNIKIICWKTKTKTQLDWETLCRLTD